MQRTWHMYTDFHQIDIWNFNLFKMILFYFFTYQKRARATRVEAGAYTLRTLQIFKLKRREFIEKCTLKRVFKKYNLAHPCIYFVFLKMTLHYRLISFKMTKFECISRRQNWISCMKQSLTILNVTFTTKYIYDFSNICGGIIFTIYTLECTWNGSLIHSRYHYSYSTLLL
jgi:hypothetical protein